MSNQQNASLYKRQWITHVMDAGFNLVSSGMRPFLSDRLDQVSVEKDIAYVPGSGEAHWLDLYRPKHAHGPLPVVFYIHGGGFSICSKDTHWIFGAEFARRGYLVVMPNYRLAPENKFPAPVEDVFLAWRWLLHHSKTLGADLSRVIIAGESAGANLALGLMLSTLERRGEEYAQPVYDAGVQPKAVIASCGALDMTHLQPEPTHNWFVASRMRNIRRSYVDGASVRNDQERELLDPLVVLEGSKVFERPLPPIFVSCGENDPILSASKRLGAALARRNSPHLLKVYEGEGHAFNAFVFRQKAKECWADQDGFLAAHGIGPTMG